MPKPTYEHEALQIDEFLAKQSIETIQATIEPVKDEPTKVTVTPFAEGVGCSCHLAVTIQKDLIDHVIPTGEVH